MNGQGASNFGQAVSNLIADTLHKVLHSVIPHHQEARVRHTTQALQEAADSAQTVLGPIMAHVHDTGKVHPLLEPLIRSMAGKTNPES